MGPMRRFFCYAFREGPLLVGDSFCAVWLVLVGR
jgi:hypothetical protein